MILNFDPTSGNLFLMFDGEVVSSEKTLNATLFFYHFVIAFILS